MPVDALGQPVELFGRQYPGNIALFGPDKMALVETAQAQPDAVFIPAQDFNAGMRLVAKNKGGASFPYLLRERL
nr:hypothetical protein [Martelella alba]